MRQKIGGSISEIGIDASAIAPDFMFFEWVKHGSLFIGYGLLVVLEMGDITLQNLAILMLFTTQHIFSDASTLKVLPYFF